ncbi:hypothetical protein ACFOLD_08615 [Kocuria carniphila]
MSAVTPHTFPAAAPIAGTEHLEALNGPVDRPLGVPIAPAGP